MESPRPVNSDVEPDSLLIWASGGERSWFARQLADIHPPRLCLSLALAVEKWSVAFGEAPDGPPEAETITGAMLRGSHDFDGVTNKALQLTAR